MDEKRLWAAVLIQAIKDLAGFTLIDNARDRPRLQKLARAWFASNNHELGSYLWICDELGLSPSWLRRRMMLSIATDQMTKGGFGDQLTVSRVKAVVDGAAVHWMMDM
jgi:hypothetical protein